MVCMLLLLYQEFFSRRPWKEFQQAWFRTEKARMEKNLKGELAFLESGTKTEEVDGEEVDVDMGERVEAARAKVKAAQDALLSSEQWVKLQAIEEKIAAAEVSVKDQETLLAFAKADEDEAYYYYRHAKHAGHTDEVAAKQARVDAAHKKVLELSDAYDEATAARDALLDEKSALEAALKDAKQALATVEADLDAAERAVEAADRGFWDVEIRQIWNQDLDLVDRCHSCHMGYDKCGFSDPEEILHYTVTERLKADDIRKRYCVTRGEAEAYVTAAESVRDSWYEEDENVGFEEVKADLLKSGPAIATPKDGPQEPVLTAGPTAAISPDDAEVLFRTHPHYWQLIRKHPTQKFGCTTCHYGQGRQTKGIGLNLVAAMMWEWDRFLAPFDHAKSDHYWIEQLLDNERGHTEASCFNCHKNDYELDYAPRLTEGRKLVQHLGCTGCHPLGPLDPERKAGPTLAKVASKIEPDWMYAWIKNPFALRPRTRMPNFWPDAVTPEGRPNPIDDRCVKFDYDKGAPPTPAAWVDCYENREEEVAYIMAYLLDKSAEVTYPEMPESASAARGESLFTSVGCQGCHNLGEWAEASDMPGSLDRDYAPNLTGIGNKVKDPGWFFTWLKNPKSYWHETRMPSLRLSDQEAWDLAAYLGARKEKTVPAMSAKARAWMTSEGAAAKGEKLIGYYGCFGCHEIDGFEGRPRIGVDLTLFGAKPAHKLDFGDVEELVSDPHAQTWEAWVRTKLKAPRSYTYERAVNRMPQFNVTDAELDAAVIFLKSQNEMTADYPEDVLASHDDQSAAIQRGAFLVDIYNCRGCHMIDDRGIDIDGDHVVDGGDIYRLYADSDDKYRAPPKLMQQGRKVYPDWLFGFLKQPFKVRENYKLRMPTFQFSDEQASELVAYFAAKADSPYPFIDKKCEPLSASERATAKRLFAEAQCTNCHSLDKPPSDPKNVAPNLRLAAERLQYDWLFDWLKDPQAIASGVGMPNFFAKEDEDSDEYTTPLIDIADGDWRRQIDLLRAYVVELGGADWCQPKLAAATPAKKTGRGGRRR